MKVKSIVKNHLMIYGYDGLYNPFRDCACNLNDLMDCEFNCFECVPGHYRELDPGDEEYCEYLIGEKIIHESSV